MIHEGRMIETLTSTSARPKVPAAAGAWLPMSTMMTGGDQSISERVSPIGRKSEVSFIEGWRYERLDSVHGLSYSANRES
jgi:hypothetical protein